MRAALAKARVQTTATVGASRLVRCQRCSRRIARSWGAGEEMGTEAGIWEVAATELIVRRGAMRGKRGAGEWSGMLGEFFRANEGL